MEVRSAVHPSHPANDTMCWNIKNIWHHLLHLGDVSGKLTTLVALPSALFAVAAFYEEIGDLLTPPDVKADIHSVGLRCGLAIDRIPDGVDRHIYALQSCYAAPLSAWVKLDLENEDAIDRILASVAFRISFPEKLGISNRPLLWTEARVVNHIIQNDEQTRQGWPWRALLLAADQRVPIEVDFRAFETENQKPFSLFRDLILQDPSPLADVDIPVEVLGRFSGSEDWVLLGDCKIPIPQASVVKKRQAPIIRGLTRRCDYD